jgi:hypothetical protein
VVRGLVVEKYHIPADVRRSVYKNLLHTTDHPYIRISSPRNTMQYVVTGGICKLKQIELQVVYIIKIIMKIK